jgi:mannonate dehydratase
MKPGLGLYKQMLTAENFRFARQAGAEAIVAHLVDYFPGGPRIPDARSVPRGWGVASRFDIWTVDELVELRRSVEAEGLELAAIENFEIGHWYAVLLDGSRKEEQLEGLQALIRNVGAAGIPIIGYNFSLAAVWGHMTGPFGRGGAESVRFDRSQTPPETEIPRGMVWNMIYDPDAPEDETIGEVGDDEMWSRLSDFLHAVVPVAEEAGVRLAIHPDDPPMTRLRRTARIATHPDRLQRILEIVPSRANALEFCQGTIAEMPDVDVYETIERFAAAGNIAYVHFRNVRGHVPDYTEVFIDEGDVDMIEALRRYVRCGFDGVIIPDHTPQMTCAAPWHAGMAYALGYIRAALRVVEAGG